MNRIASLILLSAIVMGGQAEAQDMSQVPTSGPKLPGAPSTVTMPWGTFTLAPRIAAKIRAHEPINVVYSYQASGIPLYSQQQLLGFQRGCAAAQTIYPMKCTAIAPVQEDANEQVSQIQAKLATGEVDCISVMPVAANSLTVLVNQMVARGIPAFSTGVPTHGHEFTNFTQIPLKEGAEAAAVVLKWMTETGHPLKVFAMSGGAPSQEWAQGRLKGFQAAIEKATPDAQFLTTASSAIDTSFEPGRTYDTYRTFLLGHPNVQFILNVDIGAEYADRAVSDLNRVGKVFTLGWNVSTGQLNAIESGIQVALLDQRWPDQGAFGPAACARFLSEGEILPNTQSLLPVLKADVPAARAQFQQFLAK